MSLFDLHDRNTFDCTMSIHLLRYFYVTQTCFPNCGRVAYYVQMTIMLFADENSLLEALPKKMKTDLAIHVHFNTLTKVKLFQVSVTFNC